MTDLIGEDTYVHRNLLRQHFSIYLIPNQQVDAPTCLPYPVIFSYEYLLQFFRKIIFCDTGERFLQKVLQNAYSFYRMHCIYIHCKCTFALPSPSNFFAEIITNTLQYNMICDPLLKLLVIPYIMSLNAL